MSPAVLILGGTGMLGTATVAEFFLRGRSRVAATARRLTDSPPGMGDVFTQFDATKDSLATLLKGYGAGDFVINCIGLIKHHIDDRDMNDRRSAIAVNADFPYALAQLAERQGFRVLQIATDCVYSGHKGAYTENDPHDAIDVYGQTKSLGEVPSRQFINLRCSIIGREAKSRTSLMEWVLAREKHSTMNGFTDHFWNGVTTTAFAKIARGVVDSGNPIIGTAHVVPLDAVNKYELSKIILRHWGRTDVTVLPTETGNRVDRTLATTLSDVNSRLWRDAGYSAPPSIARLVEEIP